MLLDHHKPSLIQQVSGNVLENLNAVFPKDLLSVDDGSGERYLTHHSKMYEINRVVLW